jgi:hypothetical protein
MHFSSFPTKTLKDGLVFRLPLLLLVGSGGR